MSGNVSISGIKSEGESEDNLKRQGSFRKLLPANTNGDSQLGTAAKMIDRPNSSQNSKEYAAYFQEYNILAEYMLRDQDLKGIYVIPSAQNSFLWFGVQFIRQGIYQGGVFRFTITLPQNFPDGKCPDVVFQTKVFHPLINYETGELYTFWGFPEWKRNIRIWKLVQFITRIFIKLDTKMTPVNEEALLLLETNFESYKEQVKKCVKDSLSVVYDRPTVDDPHYITFSPYNSEIHDPIKQEIYNLKNDSENKPTGYSWVQPGSLTPFSKSEAR
ncbi:AKT-interacting protein homolog A-like isoform X2 [Phymastichus coffea]|uniref:AKT-interacting protein homolog A-like isoform X2 n=1 Tax=Phymastichus coffea TaxID=108790 RepID=UPI00273BBB9C|nr:AKT-interacting protein homolog A-like isoform X2 [Phymastichus coffea]